MSEAPEAKAVVDEFLARQRKMYAGGELAPLEELLAADVVWHVPGTSPIAGDYRGRDAVLGYFRLRPRARRRAPGRDRRRSEMSARWRRSR